MTNKEISKYLSLVLRHKPEVLGITLDEEGWTSVAQLLQKLNATGKPVTLERLEGVVLTNDKRRFAFNQDHSCIRASQGHSLVVDLQLPAIQPPDILYHGTAERYVAPILEKGLQKQSRQYVHLSRDVETALQVGSRHGKPALLKVNSGQMYREGEKFFQSQNGVWLTEYVAPTYLEELHRS